jgi:peptidoglycan L-alanyl-D-glutamate endopeptidase CwlK
MPYFGRRSRERLATCHPHLQLIANEAIRVVDFTIISGFRSDEEQANLYARGRTVPGDIVTWVPPGESRHNADPSEAFDFAPWPIDWEDVWRFGLVCGVLQTFADEYQIEIEFLPEKGDYGHVQLRRP